MIVSDTTGNVKKCRRLICTKWPWILNCPDPCHQLNLMMKDVMVGSKKYPKILAFTEVRPAQLHFHPFQKLIIVSTSLCVSSPLSPHTSRIAIMANISSGMSSRMNPADAEFRLAVQQNFRLLLPTSRVSYAVQMQWKDVFQRTVSNLIHLR